MQDFALHGADIVEALGLHKPHLIGHSMGGMVAAEMAAAAPGLYGRLVLIAPLGLWLEDHPITDIYSLLPFEFPPLLFHDAAAGTALMAGGLDFNDTEAIKTFLIANNRRLGTAGKVLFPIPDRKAREAAVPHHQPDAARVGGRRPIPAAAVCRSVARRDRRSRTRDHP